MARRNKNRSYQRKPDDGDLQWLEDGVNMLVQFAVFGVASILRGACKIVIGLVLLVYGACTQQR